MIDKWSGEIVETFWNHQAPRQILIQLDQENTMVQWSDFL